MLTGKDNLTMSVTSQEEDRSPSPIRKKKTKKHKSGDDPSETLQINIKNTIHKRKSAKDKKAFESESPSPSPPRTR